MKFCILLEAHVNVLLRPALAPALARAGLALKLQSATPPPPPLLYSTPCKLSIYLKLKYLSQK